ncbi:MAG: dTDP-glucose 4,6-dehydratase [Candidatus Altiarchaeota archaeon]|nr:dTDP-glucose 4,6-dehydratase [Candidatus Altiarchaeota archaeon]
MRYLVAGGAGFIGSNFIRCLLDSDVEILNFDKLTYAGNLLNLADIEKNKNYTFVKGDICDRKTLKKVFNKFKPDVVVNFAAESHVDRSILDADEFIKTNIAGTHNLLKLSLEYGIDKFVQVSTDEVYGSLGKKGFFTEDTPLNPRNPYSASKASADVLVKSYSVTHGLPVVIGRCGNNYGPYQFPEKLIPLTILHCMKEGKIPVYGDGLNIRDWIHVLDHCRALDAIIQKGKTGEVYNIGAKQEMKNIDVVKSIISEVAKKVPEKKISERQICFVEDRKGHDRRYATDPSKIIKTLKWKPKISFKEGLCETVDWYLENPSWVKSVFNKSYMRYYKANYSKRKVIA